MEDRKEGAAGLTMKTLHITGWKEYPWEKTDIPAFLLGLTGRMPENVKAEQNAKMRQLLKELYDATLKVCSKNCNHTCKHFPRMIHCFTSSMNLKLSFVSAKRYLIVTNNGNILTQTRNAWIRFENC